jgi:hypothetical protein
MVRDDSRPGFRYHLKVHSFRTLTVILAWVFLALPFDQDPEEAFGLTTDDRPYVYLSDGGHFENLGLYEMVRRRCRFILVVDAGCDPSFAFEDLGNAVRKIYIDLGIRVRFDQLMSIKNRPSSCSEEERRKIPYYTIGSIGYTDADGAEEGCEGGIILYIKPAYHGTEGAGIVSYATAQDVPPRNHDRSVVHGIPIRKLPLARTGDRQHDSAKPGGRAGRADVAATSREIACHDTGVRFDRRGGRGWPSDELSMDRTR